MERNEASSHRPLLSSHLTASSNCQPLCEAISDFLGVPVPLLTPQEAKLSSQATEAQAMISSCFKSLGFGTCHEATDKRNSLEGYFRTFTQSHMYVVCVCVFTL